MHLQPVKSVRIRSYSGSYFPAFGLNSVRILENTDQNNSEYGHFFMHCYLKQTDVINRLEVLQKSFFLVPINKASNNVAII